MLLSNRRIFVRLQRFVFAVILASAMTSQSLAQSSAEIMRAIQAQQAQIDSLRATLDVLVANQLSMGASNYYSNKPTETLAAEANAVTPQAQLAIEQIKRIPDTDLDPALRQRIEDCATGAAKASAEQLLAGAGTPVDALLKSCSESDVRAILKDLEIARQAAVAQWQQCRDVVETASSGTLLPETPAGLHPTTFDKARATLKVVTEKGGLADNIIACAKTMDDALDSIKAQDTAAGALSAALTLASQVCAATGGNPYVCGAMLVAAILMNLFNSGNGDGDGDGKGDGKDVGNGPGPYTGKDIHTGRQPEPDKKGDRPVIVTPDEGEGNGGNFGILDPSSTLICNVQNSLLTCHRKDTPDQALTVDPNKSIAKGGDYQVQFKKVLDSLEGERAFVCLASDPKNFIDGILITLDDGTLAPIKINYDSGVTVKYPPATIADTGDKGAHCPTAFIQ